MDLNKSKATNTATTSTLSASFALIGPKKIALETPPYLSTLPHPAISSFAIRHTLNFKLPCGRGHHIDEKELFLSVSILHLFGHIHQELSYTITSS